MNKIIVSNDFYNNPNRVTLEAYIDCLQKAERRGEIRPHDVALIVTQAKQFLKGRTEDSK